MYCTFKTYLALAPGGVPIKEGLGLIVGAGFYSRGVEISCTCQVKDHFDLEVGLVSMLSSAVFSEQVIHFIVVFFHIRVHCVGVVGWINLYIYNIFKVLFRI